MITPDDLTSPSCDGEMGLARLLELISRQLDAGEEVDLPSLCLEHPQFADELAKLLPTMRAMASLGCDHAAPKLSPGGDPDDADLAGEKPLGDFRLVREIGRGGMGVVYEAEQLSLSRRMALKVLPFAAILDKRQLQRFQNEARAAAALDHPGIVSVHSVGCERGVHYYAMQLIEGQTLAQVIRELRQRARVEQPVPPEPSGAVSALTSDLISDRLASSGHSTAGGDRTAPHPDSLDEEASRNAETVRVPRAAISTQRSTESVDFCRAVARLGIQAAEALEHAHIHGVLHRDIKPGNLILDAEGKLRITDFGLARIQADPGMTVTGDILGTLRYMSPEQADGRFADERTDVYSLGVTLYELLTLQPPFKGERREELLKQIAWQDPPRLRQLNPAIPRELEIIIGKALAKETGQRYATAKEMADDLSRFLENRPIHARPPTLADRAGKWLRRHPGLAVATLVASLLVMLTAGVSTAVVWQAKREAENARDRAEQEEAVAKQKRHEITAVVNFLVKDVLGSARADTGQAQKMTMLEVLENTERKLDQALVDQPLLEAHIRFTLGEVYDEMRMHDAELRQYTRAYQLGMQHAGPEDPNTLSSALRMANALCTNGKLAEAIDIYESTLQIMRRALPPGDGNTFACMNNLAGALDEAGSFQAARKLREETLEWCRRYRTADHRETAHAMVDLAASLHHAGDVTAARDLLQETLQTQQRILDPEDDLILQTLDRLADVQSGLGEIAAARKLREQVLEVRERVLGPEDPNTLIAMDNLARSLKPAAAHELRDRMVDSSKRVLGPEHPDTLRAMNNLGVSLTDMGEVATARELLDQVLEKLQRVLGPEHPVTLAAMQNLAKAHLEMGDLPAARRLSEQLVEVRRVLGPEHPDTLAAMNLLGCVLDDMNENAAARELREQVLEICRRVLGPEHPFTLQAMGNLAASQLGMGENAAARDMYEQVLDKYERVVGPEHPNTLKVMNNLGVVLEAMGESAAARELREQVLEIRRRVLGPEHPDTLATMNDLAISLRRNGDPAAARRLHGQLLEVRQRLRGPEHVDTLQSMHNLALALEDMGESTAARELLEQEVEIRRRVQGPDHPLTVNAIRDLEEVMSN